MSFSRGVWVQAVAFFAVSGTAACGGPGEAASGSDLAMAAPIPVRVTAPQPRRTRPPIALTGTLGAKEEIPLAFKIGGVVTRVEVEAGQRVREGDLLAELSQAEIAAQVAAAREGRDKAQRDLDRARALFADSVVTLAQVQDARTQLEVAEAQWKAAEFNQQYAVVRAPAAGVVERRQVEVGQLVAPGVPVLVLRTERRGFVLRAAAADRDAVRLKVGDRASVQFDAWPGSSFGARIERVGVSASPMTGTYEIELSVAAEGRPLTSGLIGRISVLHAAAEPVDFVPATALLEVDGEWASVFELAEDGATVRRVRVRVDFLDAGMAALQGAPRGADWRVVTAGVSRLRDGDRVTITADDSRRPVGGPAAAPPSDGARTP
jgi:RND family efflux transporter MFP subunit